MNKKKFTTFDGLMLCGALLAIAGMVLGIFAGFSDPRKHIVIAFFGLAYPFFVMANVAFLVYWLLRRKLLFFLLTIIGIAFGGRSLLATFGVFGDKGSSKKDSDSYIRLMTYNVHNFTPYGEEITESFKEKMLDVVADENPDIVCFQEFYTRKKGPYDIVDSLKQMLGTAHYYFVPTMKSERESIGMAIFSRYPIEQTGRIKFEGVSGNECIFIDIVADGKKMRVYNVHFQSISFDQEDYTYLDKVKTMDPKMSSTRRIIRMLKTAFYRRAEQVDRMKAHMRQCEVPYVIAGDFNDTPASYVVNQITDSLNNAFIKKGQGFGKTYNGKFPNFQIDYIASSKDIDVINYRIIEAKLSDHFPVRSDLKVNNRSNLIDN